MAKGISKNNEIEETEVQSKAELPKPITGEIETVQASKKKSSDLQSVYSAKELAANAGKLFETRSECVTAALTAAGKSESTIVEAKRIVENFLKREVK